jgi:Tol biopolymer transport system component
VLVTASCGTAAGLSSLIGELRAPVGSAVTLRNNGGDDLALTMPAFAGSTDLYNALAFTFATPLADGTSYGVTLATTPVNQTCSAYKGASGTMPAAAGALKVGCEWTYEHVSRNTDGTVRGTYSSSSAPVLGGAAGAVGSTPDGYGDGRFVAFVSTTNLGGAPTGFRQIYFRDRLTGEVVLVSKNAAGVEGNNNSFAPAISADGLTVVFESTASNLVAGDTNGVSDIFKWSALSRTIERVSVGPAGEQANGTSNGPTVSGDGKIIAFATGASNLTTGVSGNSTINVVRRDLTTGTNTLITRGTVGSGNGIGVGGSQPALSEDGNRLAFYSFSSQLVAADNNGLWDIFVYQHDNGSVRRITLTASGGERDQGTESASRIVAPAISGNGRFVAYATTSTNVVAGDTNGLQDVFVVDLDGPGIAVKRVSVNGATQGNGDSPKGQGERPALSADGTWVAFTTNASNLGVPLDNVLMANVATGELRAVTSLNSNVSGPASISRSAAYVVFGANSQLDGRFANTGLFARFTGLARAWWWLD